MHEEINKSRLVITAEADAKVDEARRRSEQLTEHVDVLTREITRLRRSQAEAELKLEEAKKHTIGGGGGGEDGAVVVAPCSAEASPATKRSGGLSGMVPPGERRVEDVVGLPMVYVITPTYARPTQKADLIRLCYTLRLVPNVHWVIVEDADTPTALVGRVISQCNLTRTDQVAARTPVEHRRTVCTTDNPRKGCPKGYVMAMGALRVARSGRVMVALAN